MPPDVGFKSRLEHRVVCELSLDALYVLFVMEKSRFFKKPRLTSNAALLVSVSS